MVNGATSRIIYIGAWVAILSCIVGFILLAALGHDSPPELMSAMTAAFGVIAGSHLIPPIAQRATQRALDLIEAQQAQQDRAAILERRGE